MNQEDTVDITIVLPDNSSSVPIYFEYASPPARLCSLTDMIDRTGHRVPLDGYYSPAGSSAGS